MTELDVEMESTSFVLDHASKTLGSLETKVGSTEKQRHITISAVLFLHTMMRLDGTFIWTDGPKQGYKFDTVWEALATQLDGFEAKGLLDKGQHIQEYAPKLKSGFYETRKWLDKWFIDTVYLVPQHREASKPTVLTFNPNLMLEGGVTAAQMQAERDIKLAKGQFIASTRRLAAATKSKDDVRLMLRQILDHADRELEDMRAERG